MRNARKRVGRWAGVVVLAVACGALSSAAASGGCFSVDVPLPVVLPSGAIEPAGLLTVCPERSLNPVTGVHRILVGRIPVELARSRVARSEAARLDAPIVLFLRGRNGTLRLAGFAVDEGRVVRNHLFGGVPERFAADLTADPVSRPDDGWIAMAARAR